MSEHQASEPLGAGDPAAIDAAIRDLGVALALPEAAVADCLARFEAAAPALRAALAEAAEGAFLSDEEDRRFMRGLFILGAARDTSSWPLLVRLLHLPPEDLEIRLGDVVSEGLPKIVASLFDGDVDGLFAMIVDPALDEFVRGALLHAAAFLTWKGVIDRKRMEAFLVRFDADRVAGDWDFGWYAWQAAIALLGMGDLAPLVRAAFADGRIDDSLMQVTDFEEDLALTTRAPDDSALFEREHLGYVDDPAEALRDFVYEDRGGDDDIAFSAPDEDEEPWDTDEGGAPGPGETVINPHRHVGRNDPCPCGSGKKFKKCCLIA